MLDSVIFDLDGTLWDTSLQITQIWNRILRESFPQIKRELTLTEIYGIFGLQYPQIGRTLFSELPEKEAVALAKTLCEDECKYLIHMGGTLYEGLEQVLKVLSARYPLFIVSNCQRGYIECFYGFHKMESYFTGKLCSQDTGLKKGENIRVLMERYGLKSPIYVGDTQMDYEAAHEAGIPMIHAAYGFGTAPEAARRIETVTELIACLEFFKED